MPLHETDQILQQYDQLKSERSQWESLWDAAADLVIPRKANMRSGAPGQPLRNRLFDSTGELANEVLASSLHGLMTPMTQPWVEASVEDVDTWEELQWLDQCNRIARKVILDSNFHSAIDEFYVDAGGFGTSILLIEEDPDLIVRFSCRNVYEAVIGEDHREQVDQIYRCVSMTGRQILQRGWKLDPKGEETFEKEPNKPHEILHVVKPRTDYDYTRRSRTNLPYASYWIGKSGDLKGTVLHEGGYHEFPYAVIRWRKRAGELYGRGPGLAALPDLRLLQAMEETAIKTRQLAMQPPLAVPVNGLQRPFELRPNEQVPLLNMNDAPRPLLQGIDPRVNNDEVERKRGQIRAVFFNDLLLTPEGDRRTATEIIQRADERAKVITALLGRFQSEVFNPLMERAFGIMLRRGIFPPPPESLQGKQLVWRYSSPLHRAMGMVEVEGIMRLTQMFLPLVQAGVPVMEKIDWDATINHVADVLSVPKSLLKSPETMEAERQAAQQAMQAQQMLQGAQQVAQTAQTAAKAEEAAPPGGAVDNVIQMMAG